MNKADAQPKPTEAPRQADITSDCYEGVNLAPSTLESLVTWDVSAHAKREQDRLSSVCRTAQDAQDVQGGY